MSEGYINDTNIWIDLDWRKLPRDLFPSLWTKIEAGVSSGMIFTLDMVYDELEVQTPEPLIARPNPRGLNSEDQDERVNDLLFRNDCEFAVGHGVSTRAKLNAECKCSKVTTC